MVHRQGCPHPLPQYIHIILWTPLRGGLLLIIFRHSAYYIGYLSSSEIFQSINISP
uniref:Uncharacterized protein n=1 Tax=Lepeophtheirus salmonis TaxID=72036 RepID=A0A0K2TDB0_LEPSM